MLLSRPPLRDAMCSILVLASPRLGWLYARALTASEQHPIERHEGQVVLVLGRHAQQLLRPLHDRGKGKVLVQPTWKGDDAERKADASLSIVEKQGNVVNPFLCHANAFLLGAVWGIFQETVDELTVLQLMLEHDHAIAQGQAV